MKVRVTVNVYDDDDWSPVTTGEMSVKAEPEGLVCIDWHGLCAGLVEGILADAMTKKEVEETTDE